MTCHLPDAIISADDPVECHYDLAVLVAKKAHCFRSCVDTLQLNQVTIKHAYPVPRSNEILTSFPGSCCFMTVELFLEYQRIPLCGEERVHR